MNNIKSSSPDQITIIIDGVEVTQFSNVNIVLTMDQVGSGFYFECPFFPGTKDYRDIFKPFAYQSVQIYVGGTILIDGVLESISPNYTDQETSVACQGRSRTGVIIDCTFEQDDFKGRKYLENGLQFKKQNLEQIAGAIVKKFDLDVSFPDGSGAIFEVAAPGEVTESIFDFLQNLARQRSLLISQTNNGDLLFRQAKTSGIPIAELLEGNEGVMISTATYDGTTRFSRYNAFGQQYGKNDNFALVKDESVQILRPKSINANDTNAGNIKQSAEWALSSDIANSISIPVSYEGWLTPSGKLWQENELIILHAPSIMIYKPYAMLIKSVSFFDTPESKYVDLVLTLPESYTGKTPEAMPWE